MYGLSLEQETALTVAWMSQEQLPLDLTNLGLAHAFVALRDKGLVKVETDLSERLAFVQQVSSAGDEHYFRAREARRGYCSVSNDSDELMMLLAVEDKRKRESGKKEFVSTDFADANDYAELSRNGLLKVQWGDNVPFLVEVTEKGRTYSEGSFLDQLNIVSGQPNIEIKPIFSTNVYANSSADSNSTSSISDVTLGTTIGKIVDLNIGEAEKAQAQQAAEELESATKRKDYQGFAEKLEKVASVAKSSSELAAILLPFAKTALGMLFGV